MSHSVYGRFVVQTVGLIWMQGLDLDSMMYLTMSCHKLADIVTRIQIADAAWVIWSQTHENAIWSWNR